MEGDPRKLKRDYVENWQEGIEDEKDSEIHFDALEGRLSKLGLALPRNTKILEIGSGNSVFLRYLQKQGFDAVGVDANPRGKKIGNIVRARIEKLPFPDETFGLIFSNSVFDSAVYEQDQVAMVKEIARVLKHGGVYYGTLNWDTATPFEEHLEVLSKKDYAVGSSVYRKK